MLICQKISCNKDMNGYKFNGNLCDPFEGYSYMELLDIVMHGDDKVRKSMRNSFWFSYSSRYQDRVAS